MHNVYVIKLNIYVVKRNIYVVKIHIYVVKINKEQNPSINEKKNNGKNHFT